MVICVYFFDVNPILLTHDHFGIFPLVLHSLDCFQHIRMYMKLREVLAYLPRQAVKYTTASIICISQAKIAPEPQLN